MKVLVVGAGKLGYKLAEAMVFENIDVTLIDKNNEVLKRINEHMDVLTITGNGIDINVLNEIGIEHYDLTIAATNNDETNTIICVLAKKLGSQRTIARIRNPQYLEQMDFIKNEMGIDVIINPDLAAAEAMERYLLKKYSFHLDEFASGKVQLADFRIGNGNELIGRQIKDIKGFENVLIVAISKDDGIVIPNGLTVLNNNDLVYLIGKSDDIKKINERYNFNQVDKKIENVMILGGSNIAYYLSKKLVKYNISVKLIEKDRLKAEELSEKLDNVLIIHGDGTDIDILEEENLDKMDAFIGATGFDEQNLLMALLAKQSGVTKTIAKVSRENYSSIIDRIDIDMAINPIHIAAGRIIKFLRGGKVLSVSLLLGGEAEVTEVIVHEDSPYIDIPLKELELPEGIIIGAILRKNKVIIPKGDSIILPRDRIVVFSLSDDLEIMNNFFKPNKGGRINELWNRAKGIRNNINN